MTLGSLTDASKSYDITLDENGKPTRCTCLDYHYRSQHNASHVCKHMDTAVRMFEVETERAAKFLALQAKYDYRSASVRDAKRAAYNAMYDPCLVA